MNSVHVETRYREQQLKRVETSEKLYDDDDDDGNNNDNHKNNPGSKLLTFYSHLAWAYIRPVHCSQSPDILQL
jgi:hypothetical protein